MKESTRLNKLNELLGLTKKAEEVKIRSTGKVVGITEEEIQEFREIQGLIYFLQAPALFTAKICPHCGEQFFVSRKYVAYCSYTCIQKSLAEQGIQWKKGQDLEALILDPQVYDGNEPLWIRSPILDKIREMVCNLPPNLPSEQVTDAGSETPPPLNPEPTSGLNSPTQTTLKDSHDTPFLSTDSMIPVMKRTGPKSSNSKRTRRVISFES